MFLTSFHSSSGKQKVGTGVRWQQTAPGSRGRCAATDWALEMRAALHPPQDSSQLWSIQAQGAIAVARHKPPFFLLYAWTQTLKQLHLQMHVSEHAATCANKDREQMVIVAQQQIPIEQIIWVLYWDFCSARELSSNTIIVAGEAFWRCISVTQHGLNSSWKAGYFWNLQKSLFFIIYYMFLLQLSYLLSAKQLLFFLKILLLCQCTKCKIISSDCKVSFMLSLTVLAQPLWPLWQFF